MANRSKRLGTTWENAVVDYLRAHGFPHAERRAQAGTLDRGDINAAPGLVIECKNTRRVELALWLEEVRAEVANARADIGVVWSKRRGKASAANGYVICDGATFVRLLRDAGYGDPIEDAAP